MDIKLRKNDDGIYLVELYGSLDLYSSTQFKNLILKMIEKKAESFIISLKEVDRVNSAGIGALIFISSTLKKLNSPLVMIIPEGPVMNALEVSRLKGYFTIASSLKEAIPLSVASQN